jgi:hypothetical protein
VNDPPRKATNVTNDCCSHISRIQLTGKDFFLYLQYLGVFREGGPIDFFVSYPLNISVVSFRLLNDTLVVGCEINGVTTIV